MPRANNYNSFPDELLSYYWDLEDEWKKSKTQLSEAEWLRLYPELRAVIPLKILEWKAEADTVRSKIKESLIELQKLPPDEIAQFMGREWIKLTLGQELLTCLRHTFRLKLLLNQGKPPGKDTLSQDEIEKARGFPILELIQTDIRLRRTGKSYCGLCPFHSEKTPSFHVYPETNTYYCFGCHETGDTISYLTKTRNASFKEAVRSLN